MAEKPVLVTGATGATGGFTIQALLNMHIPVRALVRKDDERAAGLRALGVETRIGDLLEIDDVRAAMEGTNAAYFVYPLAAGTGRGDRLFCPGCRRNQAGGYRQHVADFRSPEFCQSPGPGSLDFRARVGWVRCTGYPSSSNFLCPNG